MSRSASATTPGRIRVLEFITGFFVGGTEKHVLDLTRRLDPSTFEVHLACFLRGGPYLEEAEAMGVPLQHYQVDRLYGARTVLAQARLARYLRAQRIHVVHSYGFYANVFAVPAARLAATPVVLASVRDRGDHLTSRQRRVHRTACSLAHHVLANADAIRDRLVAEGYRASRLSVIRNGVDLARFARAARPWAGRRALGFPDDAPLVAVVARLDRVKGIEYFLEAAALLGPRFPAARFVVVGDTHVLEGDYRAALETRARKLGLDGRLAFAGIRSDVPELLADTAVSVLPSLSEGHSNTLLESMAAGVPVVATAVGGNVETVENGLTGFLVPSRDAHALAEAVGRLLAEPARAQAMGAEARRRVLQRFSMERMVEQTQDLYVDLLRRGKRGPIPVPAPPARLRA